MWSSKLQSCISLSTKKAEYVSLSSVCKELLLLLDQIPELASAVGLSPHKTTNMHVKIHEDNVGVLTLANMEPGHYTPRSKHYALRLHWFRSKVFHP